MVQNSTLKGSIEPLLPSHESMPVKRGGMGWFMIEQWSHKSDKLRESQAVNETCTTTVWLMSDGIIWDFLKSER